MAWCGAFGNFLDDAKRRRIRLKKRRNFVQDYFLMSEVTDYGRLRLAVNGVLGLLLCSLVYYYGWKNINFALELRSPGYGLLVKWFIIFSTAAAFTLSPIFRCAILCLLVGALGKNGQAPVTALIAANLSGGPIENIINNYKLTAEIIICHLQLQAKIISSRLALFTGPLEELLENSLEKGLKTLKSATKLIRRLIAPFLSEIKVEKTDEDIVMDKTEKQLSILSQRRAMGAGSGDDEEEAALTEEEMKNASNTQPAWTKFKTKVGRKIVQRINQRCNDIYGKGIEKCKDLFASVQQKCYDALPILINYFVCDKFSMESACQNLDRRRQQLGACSGSGGQASYRQAMEKELNEVVNLTGTMDAELKVSLHMLAVEAPRVELDYSLRDMALLVRASVVYVAGLLSTIRQLVMAFFVYTVYKLFSQGVNMIEKYNNDVDFNNCFIGRAFWLIDEERRKEGKTALLRIEKHEWKLWKLTSVISIPTKKEICAVKYSLLMWILLAGFACGVMLVDSVFYSFLDEVVTSSENSVKVGANASAEIVVLGKGAVADFMNRMISLNRSTINDEELTNRHCLSHPRAPNWPHYIKWIIIPLFGQLLMQIFFSYIVKRLLLNYFLPFMFPRRDQTRLIYLYNKVQFLRLKDRKEARARIRFMAQRWKIMEEEEEGKSEKSSGTPRRQGALIGRLG